MKVSFAEGCWNPADFEQITSLRTDGRLPFEQEEDCIVNDVPREVGNCMEYHYISLLHRKWLQATREKPVLLEAVCSYHQFGAPLLVLTDDLLSTEDGYPAYGHHYEIVAFEEGLNVWELNGAAKPILVGKGRFSVPEAGEKLTLSAAVYPDRFEVNLCGNALTVPTERFPASFRAGITACEGVNRFYSFSAE